MPQDLIDEIELRVERSQNKVDRSLKLEVLNHYRELVEEEAEEAAQPRREGTISKQDVQQISEALSTLASPLILEKEELSELAKAAELHKSETKISAAVEEIKNIESDRKSAEREERERQELLRRQLQQEPGTKLPTAEELEKALAAERAREQKAKEERDREKQRQEKSVRRLESKVEELLEELKSEVESAQAALEEDLNIIDRNKDGLVSKDEIIYAFNVFKTKIPAEHIEKVVAKLDIDNDGLVPVEDLVKMAREFDFDLGDAILEQQKRDRVAIEEKKQRIEKLQGQLQEHKDVLAPETDKKKDASSSGPTSTGSQ
jgi:LETM1 and EF-hand domain-containing protein 1